MQRLVDALWEVCSRHAFSWVGFYLYAPEVVHHQDNAASLPLILGPRRDTPACSPIGLHGVCGQALTGGCIRIVDDIAVLGASYIACDPEDRSEIVLPCFAIDETSCSTGESKPRPAARRHDQADEVDESDAIMTTDDGVWGVLDIDSREDAAFTMDDAVALHDLLITTRLTCHPEALITAGRQPADLEWTAADGTTTRQSLLT